LLEEQRGYKICTSNPGILYGDIKIPGILLKMTTIITRISGE